MESKSKKNKDNDFWLIKITLVLAIAIIVLVNLMMVSSVSGKSMEPTLYSGDIVVSNRIGKLNVGDIVVIEQENPSRIDDKYWIKRIIAEEDDSLEIHNGNVVLNGTPINEPYTNEKWNIGDYEGTIPKGQVFVMGDNRNHSYDSREIGLVSVKNIKSKYLFTLYSKN